MPTAYYTGTYHEDYYAYAEEEYMPGVIVETVADATGTDYSGAAGGTYFLTGQTERGSVTQPVLVRSMAEARRLLGDRVSYGAVHDQLLLHFAEGGRRAYVARTVGESASTGTLTLKDRAGSPVNTLRVDANSPGAWSADLTVEIADGPVAGTYRLIIRYKGAIVESYDNLSTPAAAATATAYSDYVVVTSLGSGTAAPSNNPAVKAPTALSAGSDDRATVTATTHITVLGQFTADLGSGIVGCPGQPSSLVGTALAAHCAANERIGAVAAPVGTSVASAAGLARTLRAAAGAEYLCFIHPWVTIPDESGGVRTISPEGFAAGLRGRTVESGGPWLAPAGANGVARYATGIEATLTSADIDTLAADAVSAIKVRPGFGVRLYGWRSLSPDPAWRYLTYRDVLNHVAVSASDALEQFVNRTIDGGGRLFTEVATALTGVVAPVASGGGLYTLTADDGTVISPGYQIDVSRNINTPATIAAGELHAALGLRPSPLAETIWLKISKSGLRTA